MTKQIRYSPEVRERAVRIVMTGWRFMDELRVPRLSQRVWGVVVLWGPALLVMGGCASHPTITPASGPDGVESLGSARSYFQVRGTGAGAATLEFPVSPFEVAWLQPDSIGLARWRGVQGGFERVEGSRYSADKNAVVASVGRDGLYGVFGASRIPAVRDFQFNICGLPGLRAPLPPAIATQICPTILCRGLDAAAWSRSISRAVGVDVTEAAARSRFSDFCALCTRTPEWTPLPECGVIRPSLDECVEPGVASVTVSEPTQLYTRDQLIEAGLDFWPDGRLGIVRIDGRLNFFAANSVQTGHTRGTLSDPAMEVVSTAKPVDGIEIDDDPPDRDVYEYAAGGPVYRAGDDGPVLLIYHAERHKRDPEAPGGKYSYSDKRMAVYQGEDAPLQDLGLILQQSLSPAEFMRPEFQSNALTGTGSFAVKDGQFYLFFPETQDAARTRNHLCVARAPVDAVERAARDGDAPRFLKYYRGRFIEPGVGGRCTALELGNPLNRASDVIYNTAIDRFVMVTSFTRMQSATDLHLAVSADGIHWSPRIIILARDSELFYPTIVGVDGNPLEAGNEFYVYYTDSEDFDFRWNDASQKRIRVTFDDTPLQSQTRWWEFDTPGDAQGWRPLNGISLFEAVAGTLVVEPSSGDPYMRSPFLDLCAENYNAVAIRMKTDRDSIGQVFFTSSTADRTSEANSRRFRTTGDGEFYEYLIDMADLPGWAGRLAQLRVDPTVNEDARVTIDYIRLLP